MMTLADKSLLSRGDNKPPMLEKHVYDSWKSRMELYMMNRPHGRMILASVEKGPLVWPSITEDGVTRLKEYVELTPAEAIQADCNIKAFQEWYEHVGPEVASPQDGKVSRWCRDCAWLMISKMLKITMSNTSSRNKLNPRSQ
ncbi:hypothetical protein Tco_0856451 [Tanacetum coccineum]|uniref:Integrase, catalytic region, zinc finger, CCHC-type, peptidase aspartic, catalytic n=1 Tax=Tanacetum coccineum TaxID=301880 RepID=A0ABQ5B573_9ASTR